MVDPGSVAAISVAEICKHGEDPAVVLAVVRKGELGEDMTDVGLDGLAGEPEALRDSRGGGTLTLESAVSLKNKTTIYPIEGGTGRYAGARGTVTLIDAGNKGTLVTVRYQR